MLVSGTGDVPASAALVLGGGSSEEHDKVISSRLLYRKILPHQHDRQRQVQMTNSA